MAALDIVGKTYGRLQVLKRTTQTKHKKWKFLCRCVCGTEIDVVGASLISGNTSSCGCFQRDQTGAAARVHAVTHGLSNHPLYDVWVDIRRRCSDPRVSSYHNYGGRGISICKEWDADFLVFYNWCMSAGWVHGMEVDRYPNNDGNYEPTNCRIATCKQNQNNKRTNVWATIGEETLTAAQWGDKTGISPNVISRRIKEGKIGKFAVYGKLSKHPK